MDCINFHHIRWSRVCHVAPQQRGWAGAFSILNCSLQLIPNVVLLACGIEPFAKRVWAWLDVLYNGLEQPGVKATLELCDRANIIGGPTSFASQVFKLRDVFVQGVSLHFYL